MGVGDHNIKTIQETVKTQIVIRGSAMHLDGVKDDIKRIQMVVNEMMLTINNKGFVEPEDIRNYLASLDNGEPATMNCNSEEPVVLYTHKGSVNARTGGQKKYLEAVKENDIVFAIGPAGTGKTYQAVAMAVSSLKSKAVDRIIITRPAVEAGERLGFLPGDLKEKVDPYLTPLYDALNDMIPREKLKTYLDQRTIEIAPLAYMRGRTLHNSFIILDEAQNATPMQMKMFLTRLGVTSKAIITGDVTQIDLPVHNKSGLIDAVNILKKVDGISFVYFDVTDVVRHTLVKNIIKAYAKSDNKTKKVKKD
jgi:phosphate starvation-inducible PhoH-like protein|tara:strand:+ start:293 stop:1216 length:924 start_codon:yes stop_codon:yes gene_type:complete